MRFCRPQGPSPLPHKALQCWRDPNFRQANPPAFEFCVCHEFCFRLFAPSPHHALPPGIKNSRGRALTEFLLQWNRYNYRRATAVTKVEMFRNHLQFTHHSQLSGKKKNAKGGSSARSSSSGAGNNSRTKAASPSSKCCMKTTAMLHEALSVFTRLFVLCRRCRRPQTALFATEGNGARISSAPRSGSGNAYNGGGKSPAVMATSLAPSVSPGYAGWGVTLWVECQAEGCGMTSRVGVSGAAGGGGGGSGGTGPPPWLLKFSRYVRRRGWKVPPA